MTAGTGPAARRLEAFGLPGIGEVPAGADLADLLLTALAAAGERLRDGDVVAVSSKIVSKAEGRAVAATSRESAIRERTVRVVAERLTPRGRAAIVESDSGPVLAAAGVDASNVVPGTVLALPADPDASARSLRAALGERTGALVGVLVTDTLGRPWRQGQTDAAIGAAGLAVVDDLRGGTDVHGQPLEVTVRAVADELAAAADLVKGKLDGVPAAVLRGVGDLVTAEPGPGARALLRPAAQDWFRHGHVEAVRTALGAPPGAPGVPLVPVEPGSTRERLDRAAAVALAAGPPDLRCVLPGDAGPVDARVTARLEVWSADPSVLVALGMAAQRLLAAAWAEDLDATAGELTLGPPGAWLAIHATPRRV